jgi:hypothetical protein
MSITSCSNKTPRPPSYDYYFFSQQSLFLHNSFKQLSSMFLSIPEVYDVQNIQLSPSKKYLAFTANQDGQQVLFISKSDGSEVKRLHQALNIFFEWSPTTDQIAMIERNNHSSMFYLTKHEVNDLVLIAEADSFSWSPHGLYLCIIQKTQDQASLQLIRNDGTGLRYLSQGQFLAWHHDGQFIYTVQNGSNSSKLNVFHYEAILHDEINLNSSSEIQIRHSKITKQALLTYTSQNQRVFEYYNPHEKKRIPIEQTGLIDFLISTDEANQWKLSIRDIEQRQELVFYDGKEDQVVSQGEQIYFASISPNESKVIAIVQNGSQKSIHVLDLERQAFDLVASGENLGDIIWHEDSSRLALNLDQKTLLMVFTQNLAVTTFDDMKFLCWKES